MEKCATCTAFVSRPDLPDNQGDCCASPPRAFVVGAMVMTYFPTLRPTGWCRQHEPIIKEST